MNNNDSSNDDDDDRESITPPNGKKIESSTPNFQQDHGIKEHNNHINEKNHKNPPMYDDEFRKKRKRNLGRSARRRRKKLLELEAVVGSSTSTSTSSSSLSSTISSNTVHQTMASMERIIIDETSRPQTPSLVPTDRQYTWPAVEKLRTLSDADQQALVQQLGYLPGNALQVVARASAIPGLSSVCSSKKDDPIVLKLYPIVVRQENEGKGGRNKPRRRKKNALSDNDPSNGPTSFNILVPGSEHDEVKSPPLLEPFPTIYWVTHPQVRAWISKLEVEQLGTTLERRLQQNPNALEQMKRAHGSYGTERCQLLTSQDWQWIQARKYQPAFDVARGVAGIRNPSSIKCLHAHAAHYWSGCQENIVGQWVVEQVQDLLLRSQSQATIDKE